MVNFNDIQYIISYHVTYYCYHFNKVSFSYTCTCMMFLNIPSCFWCLMFVWVHWYTSMMHSIWSIALADEVPIFKICIDIYMISAGFMCSSYFLRMKEEKNKFLELLPAAPVHIHPKSELLPNYFSDVIILKAKRSALEPQAITAIGVIMPWVYWCIASGNGLLMHVQ